MECNPDVIEIHPVVAVGGCYGKDVAGGVTRNSMYPLESNYKRLDQAPPPQPSLIGCELEFNI